MTFHFLVYVPAIPQGNTNEGPYFEENAKYFILFLRVYGTFKCKGKYIKITW